MRALIPLNRQQVQRGLGVPVAVRYDCHSLFDLRAAKLDHGVHTGPALDGFGVILFYLPEKHR